MRPRAETDMQAEAVGVPEAAKIAGLGISSIRAAIRTGELRSAKIGKRRVIRVEAVRDWLRSKEVAA